MLKRKTFTSLLRSSEGVEAASKAGSRDGAFTANILEEEGGMEAMRD